MRRFGCDDHHYHHHHHLLVGGRTSRWRGELTLEELLSEPIIMALMDADGVERKELEAMLRRLAEMLSDRRARDAQLAT